MRGRGAWPAAGQPQASFASLGLYPAIFKMTYSFKSNRYA
jgi:hypothetical protein